jgi:hypothetical protein
MRIIMDRRFIAVMGILVLAGLGLALTSAVGNGEAVKNMDIWQVQGPHVIEMSGSSSGNGSEIIPEMVVENTTYPQPVETTDFSNASKKTSKILARNQSGLLIQLDGKPTPGIISLDNPEAVNEKLTTSQKQLAEKIALADTRVQDIIGARMYNADIRPLNIFTVNDSKDVIMNGTRASVIFTTVNSSTTLNEATFFVHVDLEQENVIRVSPLFPQDPISATT